MRTDAKIGVLCALIIGLVGGGYFAFRGPSDEPIPLSSKPADAAPDPAAARPRPDRPKPQSTDANRRTPAPQRRDQANPPGRPSGVDAADRGTAGDTGPGAAMSASDGTTDRSTSPTSPGDPAGGRETVPHRSGTSPIPAEVGERLGAGGSNDAGTRPVDDPAGSAPGGLVEIARPRTAERTDAGRRPARPAATPADARRMRSPGIVGGAVETHVVQEGDTFSTLAQQYYGSERHMHALIKANPQIANPDVLKIGTALRIPPMSAITADTGRPIGPGGVAPGVGTPGTRSYVVQSGDSFYKIARDELGDPTRWQELYELNRATVGDDPSKLRTGEVIVLPERK